MRKSWNVMVVPNAPGERIFNFSISSRTVWFAAVTAASLFIIALACVLYAGHSYRKEKTTRISELQVEISARDAELSRLNEEFTILEELEDKLRTIAGLKPRERSGADAAAGGQGGPGKWYSDDAPWAVLLTSTANNPPLEYSVQDLLDGSVRLKYGLAKVLDIFEHESSRLSSIPSINPVVSQDAWISSGFGYRTDPFTGRRRFHEGSDIVAPRGTPIIAPADGIVTFAGWRDGLGRTVELEHGYGYVTVYGHSEKLFVKKNDLVKRGDLIAQIGSSGRSTGPHVHYEVHLDDRLVNPYKYLVK